MTLPRGVTIRAAPPGSKWMVFTVPALSTCTDCPTNSDPGMNWAFAETGKTARAAPRTKVELRISDLLDRSVPPRPKDPQQTLSFRLSHHFGSNLAVKESAAQAQRSAAFSSSAGAHK
jgi:hypothetical protein